MNQDQAVSLARSLLKIVGAVLAAKGATNLTTVVSTPGVAEAVAGLIMTIAGLGWSHWFHASDKDPNPTPGLPSVNKPQDQIKP